MSIIGSCDAGPDLPSYLVVHGSVQISVVQIFGDSV